MLGCGEVVVSNARINGGEVLNFIQIVLFGERW